MSGKLKSVLVSFVATVFIALPACWAIAQFELSREIDDENVQNFYEMLAEPENTFGLPLRVHSSLVTMVSDGFSTSDYYDLDDLIALECGKAPISAVEKHYVRTILGMLQLITGRLISVHSAIVLTDGRSMVDQLDSTLCN